MTINISPGRTLVLATDGACFGSPGPGGWAVIINELDGDAVVSRSALAGRADGDTTNNRMELQAAIEALRFISGATCPVTIITDSQYVQKGVTEWLLKWKDNGWRSADRKPIKNRDLWEALDQLFAERSVSWQWVKGHSGHELNEAADRLAQDAAWGLVSTPDKLRYFHPHLFSSKGEALV